ncbi:hypothetical protein [Paenibacillus hexagrammi]|uniref:Uncharacterized protein n=1 Tax=Paenibacillus hexagrammi TaxID=2908839 RepID=A0ABY3SJH9_9BACL|nr:hypothetical protein [Paenibacillus sp. YPD9-1]UJF33295.1 hypothetical protein L0M14_27855 [Paenibacillus sp. YPD9-1]
MTKQQYRCNFRLKKNNEYLGTIYLGDPIPAVEDAIMIGEKKYEIVEIAAGNAREAYEVYVSEVKKSNRLCQEHTAPRSAIKLLLALFCVSLDLLSIRISKVNEFFCPVLFFAIRFILKKEMNP